MKVKQILYTTILILMIIIFCISGYHVASYVMDTFRQQGQYDDLAALVEQGQKEDGQEKPNPDDEPAETDASGEPSILPEYREIYEMNPDMAGWIKIEGTKVNYPVMHTPHSKDFYLRRNFEKQKNTHGCIYAQEECDLNAPSDNITIYGHNMRNGTMFAALKNYIHKDFWEKHPLIQFDTLTEHHTYKIFAVFKTTASEGKGFRYHNFIDAKNQAHFVEFVSGCKNLSFYDTGITPQYGDKLICLSTCEYSQPNGRLVVVAARID